MKFWELIQQDVISSIIDIPDPDNNDPAYYKLLREEKERIDFDVEHYAADFFLQTDDSNDKMIEKVILYVPHWYLLDNPQDFSSADMDLLKTLSCDPIELTKNEDHRVLLSLLDIILAYAYDFRVMFGEHAQESPWNICKLSATFSWFQIYYSIDDVIIGFMRRSLCYPLYRYWGISRKVIDDAVKIFSLGTKTILKCLVTIYQLFEDSERIFLNELYVKDYINWIQNVDDTLISTFVGYLEQCTLVKKRDVHLNLPGIEKELKNLMKTHSFSKYKRWRRNLNNLKSASCDQLPTESDNSDESSDGTCNLENYFEACTLSGKSCNKD